MKNPDRIPIIGLTGGIGSGKSEVARILRDECGCLVVDSDALAREAMRDSAIQETLRRWWGDGVFDDSGEVDRAAVASIVFRNEDERRRLESVIHPWVERRRREIFAAAPPGTAALVIDAPLLLEAGVDGECDVVIFIDTDEETRLDRVARTRGWDAAELKRREQTQFPLDRKRRQADTILVNNGDLHALRDQVLRFFEQRIVRR